MEKVPDKENVRPVFSHDTDKIIHSRAYSRYIDKTQVFCLFENDHITHRVLHVQLVSKVGRVIGRCLSLNEDLIEAIALGHDLGHAPFGHDGEAILDALCISNDIGNFCHNAQSVRLLTELEQKGAGLNLSLQVLDGILAHNGELPSRRYEPHYGKTWSMFNKEYRNCLRIKDYSRQLVPMSLEGCVAKVADIIAYIGRDIEDAITLRLISRQSIPRRVVRILGSKNDEIVNTLVLDLVNNSYGKNYLAFSDEVFQALRDLLRFNVRAIYHNPTTSAQKVKVEAIYRHLFERHYRDLAENREGSPIFQFTHDLASAYLRKTDSRRIVVDYLAGMTDDFFYNQYCEFFLPKSYGYSL